MEVCETSAGFHHHGPEQRRLHRQERPPRHLRCFRSNKQRENNGRPQTRLFLKKITLLLPPGRLNVKQEELDEMLKEAPGPINFTVFLTMFGEKLKGEERF